MLSASQFATMYTNMRYRDFFDKSLRLSENSFKFSRTGALEMNEQNIKAIVKALRVSSLADFE